MMLSYLYGTCYLQSNAAIRLHKFRRLSRDLVVTYKSPPLDLVINIRNDKRSKVLILLWLNITEKNLLSCFILNVGGCCSGAALNLPAGQKRCSGPSYMFRFLATGMLSSFRVRWGGWSPSWFVPLRATDESRSKLNLPSGLGYSIGVQSLAGFSWSASRPERENQTGYGMLTMIFTSAEIRWPHASPKEKLSGNMLSCR